MGETAIEWVGKRNPDGTRGKGYTWNPVFGCSKVSPGCENCYAESLDRRFSMSYRGRPFKPWTHPNAKENVVLKPRRLPEPLKYEPGSYCFVNSMSDLFHELVPFEYTIRCFAVMASRPDVVFQVLTKRPDRMVEFTTQPDVALRVAGEAFREFGKQVDARWPLPNVWLGTSVEDQRRAEERMPHLLKVSAAIRFVSAEPLLGQVDLSPWLGKGRAAWVIAGAESGVGARPMDQAWVRALRDQCQNAQIAFFYKQDAIEGRKVHTPELDGKRWLELPEPAVA